MKLTIPGNTFGSNKRDGGDGCVTQVDKNDSSTVYFSIFTYKRSNQEKKYNYKFNLLISIKPSLPRDIIEG